jgi:hypothetical protein
VVPGLLPPPQAVRKMERNAAVAFREMLAMKSLYWCYGSLKFSHFGY